MIITLRQYPATVDEWQVARCKKGIWQDRSNKENGVCWMSVEKQVSTSASAHART